MGKMQSKTQWLHNGTLFSSITLLSPTINSNKPNLFLKLHTLLSHIRFSNRKKHMTTFPVVPRPAFVLRRGRLGLGLGGLRVFHIGGWRVFHIDIKMSILSAARALFAGPAVPAARACVPHHSAGHGHMHHGGGHSISLPTQEPRHLTQQSFGIAIHPTILH